MTLFAPGARALAPQSEQSGESAREEADVDSGPRALPEGGADAASAAGDTAADEPTRTEAGEPALGFGGQLGVALLAAGAAGATATAAATNLLDAVSRNDNPANPPQNPELVEIGGFLTVAAMSVDAGVMLVGGALLVDELWPDPSSGL